MNARFLLDAFVGIVCIGTAFFLYVNYWDSFKETFLSENPEHTIYIGSAAIVVTVADTDDTRIRGLSGVRSLDEREGKLFIFPRDGRHSIWMKDMLMPIDIIWIDKNLEIVHILENISPDTYPESFTSPGDARFVLEMNAHFASSLRVKVGDRLTLPSYLLPDDIRGTLQE